MATHEREPCKHCTKRAKRGDGPCGYHSGAKPTEGGSSRQAKPISPALGHATKVRERQPAAIQNGARTTAETLLGQLEVLRAELDKKIAAVRELAQIL